MKMMCFPPSVLFLVIILLANLCYQACMIFDIAPLQNIAGLLWILSEFVNNFFYQVG